MKGREQIKMGFTCQVGLVEIEHIKPTVLPLYVYSELTGNAGKEMKQEPLSALLVVR